MILPLTSFPPRISGTTVFRVLSLAIFLLTIGCTADYIQREPEFDVSLRDGDRVLIYRPSYQSEKSSRDLTKLLLVKNRAAPKGLARNFPGAPEQLQNHLAMILNQSLPKNPASHDIQSQISIPYSYSDTKTARSLDIEEMDRTPPDSGKNSNLFRAGSEENPDVFITGELQEILFGFDEAVRTQLNQNIPSGNALIRVSTSWKIGIRSKNGYDVKKIHVRDQTVIDLNRFAPKPREMYFACGRAVDRLLKRTAWKVATHLIPHRYDTSYKPPGGHE